MPWGTAQLGLDGRAYAPPPDERSEESSLGLLHGVSTGTRATERRWERQTAMWDLLGPLSPLLNTIQGHRPAKCRKVRCGRPGSSVTMRRSESGAWSVSGCVLCGNAHVCAWCACTRAKEAAVALSAAFEKHLASGRHHDAWLGSFTLPHKRDDPWKESIARLLAAWSALRGDPDFRRWCRRWGMRPLVRVLDDTIGSNGLHAHWHVAFLPTNACANFRTGVGYQELDPELRASMLCVLTDELRPMWKRAALAAGATLPADFDAHGVDLTGAELGGVAQYFCKWGFAEEVALSPTKSGRTHWSLLDEYAAGDYNAGRKFLEYYEATRGVAVILGLKKLLASLAIDEDAIEAHRVELKDRKEAAALEAGDEFDTVRELAITIGPYQHRAALRVGWFALQRFADVADAEGADVQAAVCKFLDSS